MISFCLFQQKFAVLTFQVPPTNPLCFKQGSLKTIILLELKNIQRGYFNYIMTITGTRALHLKHYKPSPLPCNLILTFRICNKSVLEHLCFLILSNNFAESAPTILKAVADE